MPSIRIDSHEAVALGWTGVREALPVRVGHTASTVSATAGAEKHVASPLRWTRILVRFVRDAVIGVLLLMAVPFAAIGVSRGPMWSNTANLRERIVDAERWRPLMAPKDLSITPQQAGRALHSLQSPHDSPAFPEHLVAGRGERPWKQHPLPAEAFAGLRSPGYDGPVASRVVAAAGQGFTRTQLAYLRSVAEAPLWSEFDRLARASRVDVIDGQFILPFSGDASIGEMPSRRFADTKALAYAGVSRAAYLVAMGQPKQAEAALRSIVSYGFVFIDNGTSALDALVGRIVADIGRDGLHQLYTLAGNTEGVARTAATPRAPKAVPARTNASAASRTSIDMRRWQERLLAEVADPQLPRALRFESLRTLSFATCGSVQDVLFGPSANVRAAFDRASSTLARYPSERELVDLMYEATNRTPAGISPHSVSSQLIIGAATVAGAVLHNPRVEACTRVALALNR